MSTPTRSTGQPEPASSATSVSHLSSETPSAPKDDETMGVASLATKRHLESPIDGDEVVSAKIARLNNNNNNNNINNNLLVSAHASVESVSGDGSSDADTVHSQILATNPETHSQNGDSSTELVTTSILARTLLTTSSAGPVGPSGGTLNGIINHHHNQYSSSGAQDPLESLKSSLEALPAPAILDHSPGYNNKTIGSHRTSATDPLVGFASLLGPERHLVSAATVLSPIDEVDPIEWNNPAKATPVVNGVAAPVEHLNHSINPSISSLTTLVDHQLLNGSGSHHHCPSSPHHEVITEDENGKSYFNLGAAQDSTILARKGSGSSSVTGSDLSVPGWAGSSCQGQNNNGDFDDAISSSSCDSISSEDLFNSGEEFDASDDDEDEDELCTYKQQRSTVLHLSLCKLNKFRTNCVEPSLHRSVLICNTLRHIEQEIRNEDEAASEDSLKSRERLPSFWPAPSTNTGNSPGNPNPPNNCFSLLPGGNSAQTSPSQPQITDTRPMVSGVLPLQSSSVGALPSMGQSPMLPPSVGAQTGGHDPYLTPNPYNDAPYLSAYDYNSPRPTPFHTTSYDYEQDLLLPPPPNTSPSSTTPSQSSGQSSGVSSILGLSDVTSASSSLLECDSGYSDADLDMSLSSYYYTSSLPPHPVTTSHHVVTPASQPEFTSLGAAASNPAVSSPSSVVVTSSSLMLSPGAIIPISSCSSSAGATNSCVTSSSSTSDDTYHLHHHHQSFQPLPPAADLLSGPSPPCPQPVVPMEISELTSSGDICEISSNLVNISTPPPTTNSTSSLPSSGASCDYTAASSSNSSSSSAAKTTTNSISGCESSSSCTIETSAETTTTTSPSTSPPHPSSPPHSPPSNPSATITSSTACGVTATSTSITNTFAQQDSQCGLESRRSDLSRNVGNHYNNHHSLPMMDSLISPAYSSSSL